MRKAALLTLLLFMALVCSMRGISQEAMVSGQVLNESTQTPVQGATVTVAGTKRNTVTDEKGNFSIRAAQGATLSISSVEYESKTIKVSGATVKILLKSQTNDLGEIVVAMDIKKKPRELGYSVQTVAGKDIQETQRENFLNSLQGRIAGATITSTSGAPGASSSIVLRGFNSMSLNNQPLFVIDGIIVDNSTIDASANIAAAAGQSNTQNDFTNRIADINPNDIESITVLKGPEATVLYGSQASSGAIVITTKKARLTKGKPFNLFYDNSIRFQQLKRFPKVYNGFQQGRNGVVDKSLFSAFGPAYEPGTQLYDNAGNFFKTAWGQTHNLGVDFGVPTSSFRFSASYYDQQGVVPNTRQKRINLKLTNTTKIGKYIDITPSIAYTNAVNDKALKGASGYLLNLYLWPATDDAQNYLADDGGKKFLTVLNPTDNTAETDNPFFSVNKNKSQDKQDRVISTLAVNVNPLKWLTVSGRFGLDHYATTGFQFKDPQSSAQSSMSNKGSLDNYYTKYTGYNHTITATVKQQYKKWNARLTVGTRWNQQRTERYAVSGIKDSLRLFDSSATDPATRTRLSAAKYGNWNKSDIMQLAGFGEFTINYNSLVYLTASIAYESASVLPKANRNYHYPGASLSAIMSDILPIKSAAFNYWKLRGSLASTARLPDPYMNQSNFVDVTVSSNNPYNYQYAFLNANPNLKPERQKTFEIGTEMKLLKNIVSIDAAYYNTLCTDQIAQGFRASYGTGFVLNTQNNSSVRNEGLEISLSVNPIRTQDFNWNIQFNFNHMWNKVLSIPFPIQLGGGDYYDASTWVYLNARGGIVQGGSTGTITSYGYARNNQGQIIVDATTGLPTIDAAFKVHGDRTPKFTLGTINKFNYKNWALSFLWDLKVGGDVFNGTNMYLTINGKSAKTADRQIPRIVQGVLNDGLQNSATPTKNTIYVNPYYNYLYYATTAMPEEEYIERNINALRLRDISLSYTFPGSALKNMKAFKSLGCFITCTDLLLFTNYTGGDPAANGANASVRGVGAVGLDYGNIGAPLGFNIGLRAGF